MKTLLVALNAKYIHSALGIYCIKKFCKKYENHIILKEYTINNQEDTILREIYLEQPQIIGFSCYIWNIQYIMELVKTIKKIMPKTIIFLGGPEVSYDSKYYLDTYSEIDFIIRGEGEHPFYEVMEYFIDKKGELSQILGIVCRYTKQNANLNYICLDDIPFIYDDTINMQDKIIYYESSRGCPYRCSYCLSSLDKTIRTLSMNRVFSDLDKFLSKKVRQVKFIDRTFNFDKHRSYDIWNYLKQKDNGITNFHFEISIDLLDDKLLSLLKTIRPGQFQFEIGIQTTNEETLKCINRNNNWDKIKNNVKIIQDNKNIHQHLDLIAGLPKEDYNSFKQSFNNVYSLYPEQLQLGFLKVLRGCQIREDRDKYGLVFSEKAPYEILYTNDICYEDMLRLKMIEDMIEKYYNSNRFYYSLRWLEKKYDTPFNFYEKLAKYWEKQKYYQVHHTNEKLYTILLEFYKSYFSEEIDMLKQLLILDMYSHEKIKKFPEWYEIDKNKLYSEQIKDFYRNTYNIEKYLQQLQNYDSKQISRMSHIEVFDFNFDEYILNQDIELKNQETVILFNYQNRNSLLGHAECNEIEL